MTTTEQQYFKNALLALRNTIDVLVAELGGVEKFSAPPRQRRNLKAERVQHFETAYVLGKWSKPAQLRKTKSK